MLFGKKVKKIDFIVIGAQKSGTSALDYYLRQHPDIGMAKVKELHFFDNETLFSGRIKPYSRYAKHFQWELKKKVYGEVTPSYLYWEPACKRIWEFNKDIRLISILRNPIDRAFSHWSMQKSKNIEVHDFLQCVENEASRIRSGKPYQILRYSYVDRGYYSEQLRRYKRYFIDEQLLFIKYDEFFSRQDVQLQKIFSFLGVDNSLTFEPLKVRETNYLRNITVKEKTLLQELFINDIRELERLLGWDCSDWLK